LLQRCGATTLQLALLQRCGAGVLQLALLQRYAWLRRCDVVNGVVVVVFFFLLFK
jgi:hypothetical protein